jgi:hypothetical protein
MTRRCSVVIFALLLATGAATALGVARATGDDPPRGPKSNFSVERARAFSEFPVYSAGASVDGIPLVAVLRRSNGPNYVSFIYGDCDASDELGCAPPAEVQVWPACMRNISMYDPEFGPSYTRSEVRGAPAFTFEDGHRVEIQTAESTVVVFGQTRELVARVSARLEGVNVPVQAAERLPPPAAGALEGKLRCG